MADACCEQISHTKVKVEENGKVVHFLNQEGKNYIRCVIDDCLISDGPRADRLVTKVGVASVIVELKGTDVAHACDQLFSTVKHPAVKPKLEEKLGFLVVCRRYPRFDGFVAKAKQRSAALYKAGFHVVTSPRELDIERVAAIDGPY